MIILMHEPTDELFPGIIHPDAALFSDSFDVDAGVLEHKNYRKELEKAGATVVSLLEILKKDVVDANGVTVKGPALDSLRDFASRFLKYNVTEVPDLEDAQQIYKEKILNKASAKTLIRIIFHQPEVILKRTTSNTSLAASFQESPVMNIFYMRDQLIVTANGIVMGKMNSPQRQSEVEIADFCLRKIGMKPIGYITGEGAYLEGGDFLPCGNTAFIGCGLRTTYAAVNQIMENDWLGCDRFVIVRDVWGHQEQMHLDTYFNVVDKDLALLSEARLKAPVGNRQYLTADVWERSNGGPYVKTLDGVSFLDFVTKNMGMKIIPVSRPDELNYACNFLALGPRRIMAVAGQSETLQTQLKENKVDVTWVPLENLTKGFGAAHCMTQILDDGARIIP